MNDPLIDAIVAIGTNIVSSVLYDWAKQKIPATRVRFFPNSLLLSRDSLRDLDRRVDQYLKNKRWQHSSHPILYLYFSSDTPTDIDRLKPLVLAALFSEPYPTEICKTELERLQKIELDRIAAQYKNKRNVALPDTTNYELDDIDFEQFNNNNIRDLKQSLFEKDEITRVFISRVLNSERALSTNQTPDATPADAQLKEYCEEMVAKTSRLMMTGIDAFLRQEQIESQLEASFVSLYLREMWDNSAECVSENAEQVFRQFKYVIARGDAGSGKTTLLQWISLQCARSVLRAPLVSGPTSGWTAIVPILIPLRRVVSNHSRRVNVSDFVILSTDSIDLDRKLGPVWIDSILRTRNTLVMFDGLDELSFKDRSDFWKFLTDFSNKFDKAKIIITSRHLSFTHTSDGNYKNIFSMTAKEFSEHRWEWNPPAGFIDFQIAPLNRSQIHLFIQRWHQGLSRELLHPDITEQLETYPQTLIEVLSSSKHEDVLSLCKIPLLCALVCIVNLFSQGRLPDSIRKLYTQSVRILSQTRDEIRNVPSAIEYRSLRQPLRTDLLGHIALTMQEGVSRTSRQMTLEVDKKEVLIWIKNYKNKSAQSTITLSEEDILRFYTERSNILREPTLGKIDFIHRSFLEYLAANEFVRRREVFSLGPLLFDDSWTGVLKFMMDTEDGGAYFAGAIIDLIVTSGATASAKLSRISEILSYSNRLPDSKHVQIRGLLTEVWPPDTVKAGQVIRGFTNLPAESLIDLLEYSLVKDLDPSVRHFVAELICSHGDQRIRNVLRSGYLEDTSPEVALVINNRKCAHLSAHPGLWPALAYLTRVGHAETTDVFCDDVNELVQGWQTHTTFYLTISDPKQWAGRIIVGPWTRHLDKLRQADFVQSIVIEDSTREIVERVQQLTSVWGIPRIESTTSPP
ncbi:NACHT domain-containing protein [Bradyrhizobium oligotrophicum]|uniref:NACHT domain-containing protein n=1 Tax=Bradyrhizobium TaxID=374 RepID=UPI003EBAE95E